MPFEHPGRCQTLLGRAHAVQRPLASLCEVIGRRELEIAHHEPGSVIHEAAIVALETYHAELGHMLEARKAVKP